MKGGSVKVSTTAEDRVLTVLYLGRRGLYAKKIAEISGLSLGHVYYLLSAYGISLHDYRRGENTEGKSVIDACHGK